jgi:hypothetical protein
VRRREAVEDDEVEAVARQPPPATWGVLDLQRMAGNRAVGAALQRWAGPALAAAAKWPKTKRLRIGSFFIPVKSHSESSEQPGAVSAGAGQRGGSSTGPGTMSLILENGEWEDDLMLALDRGGDFEQAELVVPSRDGTSGWRWILTGVDLVSVSWVPAEGGGRPLLHVILDFKQRAFSDKPR